MAKTPHALVTGGAGFIGSHLAEHLLETGWRVTVLDDLSTGSRENLASVAGRDGFLFVEGGAEEPGLVEGLSAGGEAIFHLAAAVGVQRVVDDPVGTVETNHAATRSVLHAAHRHGLRVLITSSSEVYGANPDDAFREDAPCIIGPPTHRRWCYSASKLLDEFHAQAFHYRHGVQVVIARLFNTIGPRQVGRYGMVVPRFVSQALAGEPITVYGDGRQRRCFTWVGDVVECLAALLTNADSAGQVFNVGSDEETSILDLAERIRALTGREVPIVHCTLEDAYGEVFEDVPHRRPDTAALQAIIGRAPRTPLEHSLQRVIASMQPS